MALPPSPAPTTSTSPPPLTDTTPAPSSNPMPPISQSATPSTDPSVTDPPQSPAPPPLSSSSPSISPPLTENPASPPLLMSSPPSPPKTPAPPTPSVIPPPAISVPAALSPSQPAMPVPAALPPPSPARPIPAALPPPPSIPIDSPPLLPPPSPILQTSPPSSPLAIPSPSPPTKNSPPAPSKSPGDSSPSHSKKPSPPPVHIKLNPPETPKKSPPSPLDSPPPLPPRGHRTPAESPPSPPDQTHPPEKSPPQPRSEPSSNPSPPTGQVLVPPPSSSAKPSPASPPSEFSINPIASEPKPTSPLVPELVNSPPIQPGTPLGSVVPAVTVPTSVAEQTTPVGKHSRIKPTEAAGISVPIAFIILLVASVAWFTRRKKTKGANSGGYTRPSPIASSDMSESNFPRSQTAPLVKASSSGNAFSYSPSERGIGHSKAWFTLEELSHLTNGFSPQNILGEGGFGAVYKGCLPDGREVAVKQLKVGGSQGEREFRAEVEIISRIHHRHLVSLVGYCISENQRLLVYDFVPNNTLFYHLHGSRKPVLDWGMRVKVASGAARGIAYLHEDCHPRIIHRDIKSSNILLDNSFEARVSDFGLAKLTMDAETHVTTRVMGTFGYLAPEYASSGKLTDKSDVFSFGVVLLELITGRKPVDASQPIGDESLVEWARPLMSQVLETGDIGNLPDPRLERNYNELEMFRMVETAAACVRHSASMRPRMGLVMRALDNLAEAVDLHNGLKPGKSELFNSIANSEEIRLFQRMAFGSQGYSNDFSKPSQFSRSQVDV